MQVLLELLALQTCRISRFGSAFQSKTWAETMCWVCVRCPATSCCSQWALQALAPCRWAPDSSLHTSQPLSSTTCTKSDSTQPPTHCYFSWKQRTNGNWYRCVAMGASGSKYSASTLVFLGFHKNGGVRLQRADRRARERRIAENVARVRRESSAHSSLRGLHANTDTNLWARERRHLRRPYGPVPWWPDARSDWNEVTHMPAILSLRTSGKLLTERRELLSAQHSVPMVVWTLAGERLVLLETNSEWNQWTCSLTTLCTSNHTFSESVLL